jgi:hypothetical protein
LEALAKVYVRSRQRIRRFDREGKSKVKAGSGKLEARRDRGIVDCFTQVCGRFPEKLRCRRERLRRFIEQSGRVINSVPLK